MMETKDGLPVYRSTGTIGTLYTDNMKVGDVFYFTTYDVDIQKERTLKLRKTGNRIECEDCPLQFCNCHNVECRVEEVRN